MMEIGSSKNRNIYLSRCWCSPRKRVWLCIDLAGGDHVQEMQAPDRLERSAPGAIFSAPLDEPCRSLSDGGLFLPEGVLWSLLDPLEAQLPVVTESSDRIGLEKDLRQLAVRFRRCLAVWQHLPEALRDHCRDKLRGFKPDLLPLLDQFDSTPAILADGPPEPEKPEDSFERPSGSETDPLPPPQLDPDQMYGWFTAHQGLGSIYGPEFLARPEQAEMAREVTAALGGHDALLLEAGTGVGKTLAYLVPLVAALKNSKTRAVVSTHTRALQKQILDQDLPRLRSLLDGKNFALLMGRRNYLCLRQRLAFASRPMNDLNDALQAVAFRLWIHQTEFGLREELAGHPLLGSELESLFDSADLCLPGQCYESDRCYVQKARQTARQSELLLVNHSLLMHDMLAEHTILGEIDHIVVDEAHRLPAVVLDTHGIVVGPRRLDEVEDLLGKRSGPGTSFVRVQLVANRLQALGKDGIKASASAEAFGQAAARCFKAFGKWWQAVGKRVDEEMPSSGQRMGRVRVRDKDEAFGSFRSQSAALLEELATANEAFAGLGRSTAVLEDLSSGLEDDLAQLGQGGQLLRQLHFHIDFVMNNPDEDWVTWIDPGKYKGVAKLGATLLEAGSVLRDYWLDGGRAPIMTSATLAVGEDFTHMLNELGLARRRPAAQTSICPSPFDFHQQAKILVPAHFPAPSAPDFGRAVAEVMTEMGRAIPRKTLGLFTSYRMINEVQQTMAQAGFSVEGDAPQAGQTPVLAQRPGGSPGHLLERFRQAPQAVLLGTNTFWEGVDFPGQDLEILVVTKLPFLVPNDPWVEARCEKLASAGENPFTKFMVRDAVLRLRQGFGRLIRRVSDRGVVLILDNRLHTKNYGVTFLGALPVVPDTFSDTGDLLDRMDVFFNQP